jgi:hypothetical protein
VYLAPINKDYITGKGGDLYFEFLHNLENDIDEFRGYEIFYKFYSPGSETIAEDIIALEDKYVGTLNFIESRGFQRLERASEDGSPAPKPLIPLLGPLKSTRLKIRMDFLGFNQQHNTTEPVLTVSKVLSDTIVDEFDMKRTSSNEELKKFIPEDFEPTDPDIIEKSGVKNLVEQREPIAVSFCVLAYGRDSNNWSAIYSEAVFLIHRIKIEDAIVILL